MRVNLLRLMNRFWLVTILLCAIIAPVPLRAQDESLVASLETRAATVLVKRVGTADWVEVRRESLVGVGDSIRTENRGRAVITFFVNAVETEVLPNTEFRIDRFSGSNDRFTLEVTVLIGQTAQRVAKLLDSGSSYKIKSTGLEMAVRGTIFDVRVESSGRSAIIVREGAVRTANPGMSDSGALSANAEVPAGFGVRAERDKGLSEVVPARSFDELDVAIDGCSGVITAITDVSINVRQGPATSFARVGRLDPGDAVRLVGLVESRAWYRIEFKGGFAWVAAPSITQGADCKSLRRFPDDQPAENPARYTGLDADVSLDAPPATLITPTVTPTP